MRQLGVIAVWLGATAATATVGWLLRSWARPATGADESDDDEGDGASTDDQDDAERVRAVELDRTALLAVLGFGALGYEAWDRAAGGAPYGTAAVVGVVSGVVLAAALRPHPDRALPRTPPIPTVSVPEPPRPTLRVPSPSAGSVGDLLDRTDESSVEAAPLPATPEQVEDDGPGDDEDATGADDTPVDSPLRPSVGDDGDTRDAPTPTAVSLSDGDPDNRPDGPILFADGAGESRECQNCGTASDVRETRIATVPDREAERVPLCDDCRIAAAAREDDPDACSSVGRRVASVGGEDGRCDNCGYIGRLSAHAIVPLDDGGQPHHANAVALCETCHAAAHGQREAELTQ